MLHAFTGAEGSYPSRLLEGSDGSYYGTTATGGVNQGASGVGLGTIFKVSTAGAITILHSFDGTNGASPTGLTLGANGNFYGTTEAGGAQDSGTVFMITPSGAFTTVYSFAANQYAEAVMPTRLTLGPDGNLYGMTAYGGDNACGTVFRLTPGGTLTTLHSFPTGGAPAPGGDGLTLGSDGNLYGTTHEEVSVIFQVATAGALTVLHTFVVGEGSPSPGALLRDAGGNLFGTTEDGGANNAGSVFELTTGRVFTTLHSFDSTTSPTSNSHTAGPSALIDGGDGNFYGTLQQGGQEACVCGAIFSISPAGSANLLYYFTGTPDGAGPLTGLTLGSDGVFYGTTPSGGVGAGTVYSFSPGSATPPDLYLVEQPTIIPLGSSTTLSWGATNAANCTATGSWSGSQPLTGSLVVTPVATGAFAYTLSCSGAGGNATHTVVLNVDPPPLSMSFMPDTVAAGQSASLQWSGAGVDGSCQATGAWSGTQPGQGSQQVSQQTAGIYVYTLNCVSAAGAAMSGSATLTVTGTAGNVTITTGGGGSGGGGGALGIDELLLLGWVIARHRRSRPAHGSGRAVGQSWDTSNVTLCDTA